MDFSLEYILQEMKKDRDKLAKDFDERTPFDQNRLNYLSGQKIVLDKVIVLLQNAIILKTKPTERTA